MDYVTLGGKKELKVSKIGMGLWQASNAWNADEENVIEAVDYTLPGLILLGHLPVFLLPPQCP